MVYKLTDGNNSDFSDLCKLLDDNLDELVGGFVKREKFIQLNSLESIHNVIIAYDGDNPVGCAGFKHFDTETAEVKRVFVRKDYRGKGISKQLFIKLEEQAKECGYNKLILETGYLLTASIGLYKSIGFKIIPNYAQYKDIPESVCMEKTINI